jgi:hypothetical protein
MRNIIRHIVPLILLTGLTFSSTVSASIIPDGAWSSAMARCKLEYTQLDLSTGLHKITKITTEFKTDNSNEGNQEKLCSKSAPRLTSKMNDWVDEDNNNIVVNLTVLFCKERSNTMFFWHDWSRYEKCYITNDLTIDELRRPNKVGYNVNDSRVMTTEHIINK